MKNTESSQLYNALISADRYNSRSIMELMIVENDFNYVEPVFSTVLEKIGSDWEKGQLSLAQVYMSGIISEELLSDILPKETAILRETPRIAGAVFLDNHSLGFRMVSSIIKALGYNFINIGIGIDKKEIINACLKQKIDILMISVLMLSPAVKIEGLIKELKDVLPDIKVAVGGAPFRFNKDLWKKIGADYCGKNSSDGIGIIKDYILEKKMADKMSSMERVLTALSHKEPDRVPLFLLLAYYGAKEAGLTIEEYFRYPDNVAECQIKMQKKYKTDCYYSFYYAAVETEAFNGSTLFYDDAPPNSSIPVISSKEEISSLEVPDIKKSESLLKVLKTTEILKKAAGSEIPIIGVVMSPFSLPVMQMGFEKYLNLLYFEKDLFNQLMEKNSRFCTDWANAQLEAGAAAICYFNPLSSPSMIDRGKYLSTGYDIDKKTLSSIKGPTAFHLASGRAMPVLDDIIEAGSSVIGISSHDDIKQIKKKAENRIALLGNLNAVDMINWDREKTITIVSQLISEAADGGGFILSDNHGEIPWLVSEDTLLTIAESTEKYGRYPLKWTSNE